MTYTQIAYDVADHVATITLDRPDRLNAFTVTMQRELCAALDEVDADPDVRAVVVTGRGRGFCAGADLGGGEASFDNSSGRAAGVVDGQVRLRVRPAGAGAGGVLVVVPAPGRGHQPGDGVVCDRSGVRSGGGAGRGAGAVGARARRAAARGLRAGGRDRVDHVCRVGHAHAGAVVAHAGRRASHG